MHVVVPKRCDTIRYYYYLTGGYPLFGLTFTFEEFQTIGEDKYKEALSLLLAAWNGEPDSLRAANVRGMCRFVALYHGEYNPKRMVTQLRKVDPLTIYREGRAIGSSLTGYKKYLYQVYRIYNGSSKKYALPLKF